MVGIRITAAEGTSRDPSLKARNFEMAKIAYNKCFGGFSLSHEAHLRYAEIKGIKVYPEKEERFSFWTYWIVPKDERGGIMTTQEFMAEPDFGKRKASNQAYAEKTLPSLRDICRHDPVLIQVIEELGERANGECAQLAIEELPSGTAYRIDEYDGRETVETNDSYEWTVAP
jgi:hypothetical protein